VMPSGSTSEAARGRAASSARKAPRGRPFGKGNRFAWKPGQSGNATGFPRDLRETAAYIERKLREHLDELVTALRLHAIKGSPTHMVEALNRVAGKIPDRTELTGDNGEEIRVHIRQRAELVERLTRLLDRPEATTR